LAELDKGESTEIQQEESPSSWHLRNNQISPTSLLRAPNAIACNTASCDGWFSMRPTPRNTEENTAEALPEGKVKRYATLRRMDEDSSKVSLESRYEVDWDKPLGEGSFGTVYFAKDRGTGEGVAVKKISKRYTNEDEFCREMNALLHIRKHGGHPGICSLREHFNERGHYYLCLDLISGGEMFDHLVDQGAYSEADAARLIREVASALLYIHGLSITHGDLKPENLMLSSKNPSDACVKLVDFGCSVIQKMDDDEDEEAKDEEPGDSSIGGKTLAYCAPEVLKQGLRGGRYSVQPAMDMYSLGCILYIMLTGLHPFDLRGQCTDQEVARSIVSGKSPPLRKSPITAHLSESAIDLIEKLLAYDPNERIDAFELLQHPWVKGETASHNVIANSGKRLSMYHAYKSGIQRKVFENLVTSSDDVNTKLVSKKTSLIEQSFKFFDPEQKGHITTKDLRRVEGVATGEEAVDHDAAPLSLSGFSDLLSEHMKNQYFPIGHIVYHEGDVGHQMYFINSGTIRVSTSTGSEVTRGPGDFFGEGALLNPQKTRSATIQCMTPVHAMAIDREYFAKYLAKSDSGLYLFLREKDNIRKRNRAKMILRLQKNLREKKFVNGENVFDVDAWGDSVFIVDIGKVDVVIGKHRVFTATEPLGKQVLYHQYWKFCRKDTFRKVAVSELATFSVAVSVEKWRIQKPPLF
jgi:serine/threonine protein kinase